MPFLSAEEHGLNNHIVVCEMLYSVTGEKERVWTVQDLRPHLFYLFDDKAIDRFFGGVLFEAMKTSKGEVLSPKALGMGKSAAEEGYDEALEALFRKDGNLSALLEVSRENVLPKRIDLWIALPYPYESSVGLAIQGERVKLLMRWVDRFLQRWESLQATSQGEVDFRGFAWTKSSLDIGDELMIPFLADHLHELGLQLMWHQNYGTLKASEGKNLGFDYVFVRPTHLGDPPEGPRGENWITAAAHWASFHQFGMILWGDERISKVQIIDYLNVGQSLFNDAFQIYELGERGILPYYERRDPIYVYLYAYTKRAYAKIPILIRE